MLKFITSGQMLDSLSISRVFNFLDVAGPLMALLAFLLTPRKKTGELRMVFLFCAIQFACNLLSSLLDYVFNASNYWVYKLNTVSTFLVLLILFSKFLLHIGKKGNIILVVVFVMINTVPVLLSDGITTYNSYSAAISSFIIVAFCLYYFYIKLLRASPEERVPSTAIFWCVIGIFTYYAGAFFIFISYKYLIETDIQTVATLWRFHNLLLFIGSLYISYGIIWKDYRIT